MSKAPKLQLGPRDWEIAALDLIADEGVAALTIPKLAAQLGVTKGSFYWHFSGLDALITSTLARWERSYTDRRIEHFESGSSTPADQLKPWSMEAEADHKAQSLYLEISTAAATREVFRKTVSRVIEKRTAFLARTFRGLGLSAKAARRRATITYAAYVGLLHLASLAPDSIGSPPERARTVREAMQLITKP